MSPTIQCVLLLIAMTCHALVGNRSWAIVDFLALQAWLIAWYIKDAK